MRDCAVLRVFTRDGQGGNHLGVVTDLSGLDTASMQGIAANLGFSETVFIDLGQPVPRVRIFTPTSELPFAGHPLVGAAWYLRHLAESSATSIDCQIGLVEVQGSDDVMSIVTDGTQPVERLDGGAVAGLGFADVVSAFSVAMPVPYTVVQLAHAGAVATFSPTEDGLLADPYGQMVTVWAEAGAGRIKVRFFAPGHGVFEDPATGSAAVSLAAAKRALGQAEGEVQIFQGVEVGMPSTIALSWWEGQTKIGGAVTHDENRRLEE